MIGWFVRNAVAANFMLMVIVISGIIVLTDLKQEILPEFSLDMITITVEYRGAGPGEIEDAICLHLTRLVFIIGSYPKIALKMPRFKRTRQRLEFLIEDVLAKHETKSAMAEHRDLIDDLIALHRSSLRVLLQTDMFIAAMGPFFVGLDTVAVATSFALYVLLKHPELFDRFRKEADELFVSGDPTPQGIHRMSTTQGVIMESLRMHTMVHAVERTVTSTFEFAGYHTPAGTRGLVAPNVTHTLPEFFPSPERFDIDRYSPRRREHAQPGVVVPFGLGSHGCLGRGFAEVQMALTLATLLRRVNIDMDPTDYSLKTKPFPTHRPDGKFKVRLRQRRQEGGDYSDRHRKSPQAVLRLGCAPGSGDVAWHRLTLQRFRET